MVEGCGIQSGNLMMLSVSEEHCNPKYIYSVVSPSEHSGTYSQINVHGIVSKVPKTDAKLNMALKIFHVTAVCELVQNQPTI